jgi:glutathione S-transferase
VRIFLAEKGISVPTVQVDLRNGEQFSPAFREINPECTVPVLELDNGTRIADIVAICRYFEEIYRNPPLMGRTAEEKAMIEAWQRRLEWDGFYTVDFCGWTKLTAPEHLTHLRRWHSAVSARPSAKA